MAEPTPPDLRTLAALVAKNRAERWGYTETLDPVELANFVHREAHDENLLSDLAAVLPVHRRQVLDEAAQEFDATARAHGHTEVRLCHYTEVAAAIRRLAARDQLADTLQALRELATDPALIRWCEWPGCLRSFAAPTGPVGDPGWILAPTPGRTLLCPGHATAGHVLGYEVRTAEGWSMAATCSCGERALPEPPNGRGASEWWARHVAGGPPTLGESGQREAENLRRHGQPVGPAGTDQEERDARWDAEHLTGTNKTGATDRD